MRRPSALALSVQPRQPETPKERRTRPMGGPGKRVRDLVLAAQRAITAASSKQAAYMREDVAIFNWTLTSTEMAELKVATFADESPVKMMCY